AGIIHNYNGYLVVDSAQSIGGIKVDVKAEDVDFMSGIPYKWLNGPNGVGFLYVRENLIEKFEPDRLGWASTNDFVSLETMESRPLPNHAKRFEYGTLAFESVYALDAALDYINNLGIEAIERQNLKLVDLLRDKLQSIGVKFITPEGNRSPILSFYQENERALGRQLKEQQIYITARRWGRGQVRISPHFYNNEEDIEAFVNAYTKARRI
ncbi:MAG: aminotransferase class V-fold PLP-dependent enzyme, partial [Planctomycetes bacterium]|nr:aminotransferase class V-fold PLP-dependent enzyme [Planctomycetota bacterium]